MEQGIRIRTFIILWLSMFVVSNTNAQDYSTWGEIYDYDVGDLFHYEFFGFGGSSGVHGYSNIEIITKTYSSDSNTVYYSQFVKELESYMGGDWEYDEWTDTISYSNLDSLAIVDSTFYNNMYNGRKISYDFIQLYAYANESKYYVDGCGIAQYYYEYNEPPHHGWSENLLIYFKKGDEEWGTPHVVVGTPENTVRLGSVIAYPNPFTTSTTIEYELTETSTVQITIYNSIGEVVLQADEGTLPPGRHTFSWIPERLSEGLYYAVLKSKEGVRVVKMVKQ